MHQRKKMKQQKEKRKRKEETEEKLGGGGDLQNPTCQRLALWVACVQSPSTDAREPLGTL